MIISVTLAKQEKDLIEKIINWSERSEDLTKVELRLKEIEGKRFHNLHIDELYTQVKGILIKFKRIGIITDYNFPANETLSLNSVIIIDISDKLTKLHDYWLKINDELKNIEHISTIGKDKETSSQRLNIVTKIPRNKHTKIIRAMADLFQRNGIGKQIDNFYFARCIVTGLKRESYKGVNKKELNIKIKNRFRALKRYLHPLGYSIKFSFEQSKVIKIS